jgi:hypothetical protein
MKRLALLAVAGLLVACDDAPTIPTDTPSPSFAAVASTTSMSFPVDLVVFVDCADGGSGESVALSGNLHSVVHTTVNPNGFTSFWHNQPQGISGVGLTTGDKYQGTGVTRNRFGGSFVNGQYSDTYVNNYRIFGQGPGNNFTLHETYHVTVNANGDVTADVENVTADCS